MKIAIPVYDQVDMLDVTGPFEMFDWADIDVELLAAEPGSFQFRGRGFRFAVEKSFAKATSYDAIWVPGGEPAALWRIMNDQSGPYLSFLRRQAQSARYMCSVCEGAMLLATAGLLDGYRATTHWYFMSCFPQLFPKVEVAPGTPRFVHDRDRLTGGGISSGLDEALKLIMLLDGDDKRAQDVQRSTQYYPAPPVDSVLPAPPAQCPIP